MRLLSALSFTLLLSAPAFAADLGMYRPGTPYNSVVAPGADVCDSHCAGDAQCRGWNYVKANPKAPGVCEFISTVSTPVPSQISISGLGVSAAPVSSALVSGGSNTVRVGTAPSAKPRTNVTRVGSRKVVREPVPQRTQTQAASTRRVVRPANPAMAGESLTAQQNRYRQQGQQTQTQAAPPQASRRLMRDPRVTAGQGMPQQAAPGFRPMLDGQMPRQTQQPQRRAPQGYNPAYPQSAPQAAIQRRAPARQRGQSGRPPIGQPIQPQQQYQAPQNQGPQNQGPRAQAQFAAPQSQSMPRASAQTPVTHQNAAQMMARQQAMQGQAPVALTAAQAQQSLYGSLHDDVKVPASNVAPPADPNAPMATATSRPTTPVLVQPLDGLAGAPRR